MNESKLDNIRIVLVEPAGALNLGSIARVMKNMGLSQLILVNPHCEPLSAEAQRMAVHAKDVLQNAQRVETLGQALENCQQVVATTARNRRLQVETQAPRQILPWLLEGTSALMFGPEDRGLSNEELYHAQRFLQIPASPEYGVLNLAQAVTICCYELRQLMLKNDDHKVATSEIGPGVAREDFQAELVPFQQLEDFYQALEQGLLEIGYLHPHTANARMQKLRQLFNRSHLSAQEVAMLRGMIRQVHWKTQSN